MLNFSTIEKRGWEESVLGLILAFIHWVCDILTAIYMQCQVCRRKIQTKDSKAEFESIKNVSQNQLSKTPQHIALAFLEPDLDLTQVASLILWSVASGCQYLSLYDIKGFLKARRIELIEELTKLCRQLDSTDRFQLQWSTAGNNHLKGNGRSFTSSNGTVRICLLSREDGQADIVRSAQRLIATANAQISEETIEAHLTRLNIDPDLLVRFGLARSNLGYPPWQIRLSEIHDLDSHFCCPNQFVQVLLKYSRCTQRFGR